MTIYKVIFENLVASLTAAKKATEPGPNTPPKYISDKGKEIWSDFYEKYKDKIKEASNTTEQWTIAIAIWRNYALKRNVPPFDEKATPSSEQEEHVEYIRNRLYSTREDLKSSSTSILKKLGRSGLIKRVLKEKVQGVKHSSKNNSYKLISYIEIILANGIDNDSKKVYNFFNENKFKKQGKYFRKKVKTAGYISVRDHPDKENRLLMRLVIKFNEQQVKFLLNATDKEIKDKKNVKKELSKWLKTLLKDTGQISKEMVKRFIASANLLGEEVDEDGVNENELTQDDIEVLNELIERAKEDPEQAVTTYNIEYIRSLGNKNYQVELVKRLVDELQDEVNIPEHWHGILEDPDLYLEEDESEEENEEGEESEEENERG